LVTLVAIRKRIKTSIFTLEDTLLTSMGIFGDKQGDS